MADYAVKKADVPLLVAHMRGSDQQMAKAARRALIEAHVGLAFQEASEFDDDEALSEALCELVIAVDDFRQSGNEPIALSGYLRTAIRRACGRYKRGWGKGKDVRAESLDALDQSRQLSKAHHRLRREPGRGRAELMDLLEHVCEDDQDRAAIRLMAIGHTQKDCAERLGVSQTNLSRSMNRLELRFGVQERLLDGR